ncbi:tyrosine-type recombinase/integrase [Ruegeria arenilitoris]|uniref:tyrosine-type recombinase/integrase n=1 Tax=Ruegeria arenilitoris TaxID=1173585 RepID=UPI001481A371|nr:site-specific integrase [Ruegeria arenilitoris]
MATITQRRPGVWKAQYRAPDPAKGGKLVQRSCTIQAANKREAQRLADEREMDERNNPVSADRGLTVAAYLTHWSENRPDTYKGKPPSAKTQARDKQYVTTIIRHVGDVPMRDVTARTFDLLVKGLRSDGFAPRTVKNGWACFKKAMRTAWRNSVIRDDPSAKAIAPHVPRTEASFATWDDVCAICEHLRPDLATYVRTLFMTGLRPGELTAVRWADVDLMDGTMHVRRVASEADGELLVVEETKTVASTAVIDLPTAVVTDLRRMRADKPDDEWLWQGRCAGLPMRPTSMARRVRDACRAAGRGHLSLYSLRHGSGSFMLQEGASIKEVQDHLRHSTAQLTTDTYLHVTDRLRERKRTAFDRLQ